MNDIKWNTVLLNEFLKIGLLTEDEENVLKERIKGKSRQSIAFKYHWSVDNVDRIIRSYRNKYDSCQPLSDLLPERRNSKNKR